MAKRAGESPAVRQGKAAARRAAAQRKARRARTRNFGILGVSVAVVGVLIFAAGANAPTGNTDPLAWDLPAMGPTAEIQERVALADYAGKPLVVNFFASWCVQCDIELPYFRDISAEFGDQVNFVGVASQETGDPLLMPERHDVTFWPLAQDVGGRNGSGLSEAFGARGMPLTAFYDEDGQLLNVVLGAISEENLRGSLANFYGVGA